MSNGQEFSDPDLNSFFKHCNPVFLQRKQILNWDFQQPDFCDQMAEAQNRAARDPGSSSQGTNPWIIWLFHCFHQLLIVSMIASFICWLLSGASQLVTVQHSCFISRSWKQPIECLIQRLLMFDFLWVTKRKKITAHIWYLSQTPQTVSV